MKPFDEGKRDFWRGQLVNPYSVDTHRNREWERGFNFSYFKNKKNIENKTRKRG